MSALPQPRLSSKKPPQSSSNAEAAGGWFQFEHRLVDDIIWLTTSWSEQYCVEKILSLVNRRDSWLADHHRDRRGFTLLITPADLSEGSRWELRQCQVAIKNLTSGEFPVLARVSREEAIEQGIVNKREAGPARECYAYRICRDNWDAAVAANKEADRLAREEAAAREAARLKALAEEEAADQKRRPSRMKLTPAPVIHFPGGKVERIQLSPEAQSAMSLVTQIRPKFTSKSSVAIEFSLSDDVLQYHISEPPPLFAETQSTAFGEAAVTLSNGKPQTQSTAPSKLQVAHSNGNGKSTSRNPRNFSAIPEESEGVDFSALQDAIDELLLRPESVGKPIDAVMLATVAEEMGDLSIDSIALLSQLIKKDRGKIYSHGYLVGPAGLAGKVRQSRKRAGQLAGRNGGGAREIERLQRLVRAYGSTPEERASAVQRLEELGAQI